MYPARARGWRGYFGVHSWVAVFHCGGGSGERRNRTLPCAAASLRSEAPHYFPFCTSRKPSRNSGIPTSPQHFPASSAPWGGNRP